MSMGQVWSKADFDGTPADGHEGGRGSVLAVTAQHPGADGQYGTPDDVAAPLNGDPLNVSADFSAVGDCNNVSDRVRNFASLHVGGAFFLLGDGAVRFVSDGVDETYRALSTRRGGEVPGRF